MKLIIFIYTVFLIPHFCSSAQESIFSKDAILSIIEEVNNYQFTHPWTETDDNWIRGTYYTGVMAAYQATGDNRYLQQCDAWGEKLEWQIPKLKPGQKASGLNLLTCGQTWLESYMVENKKYKIKQILTHLDDPTVRNAISEPLDWHFESSMRYVDGLFTGPPALAMLYKIMQEDSHEYVTGIFLLATSEIYKLNNK